MTILEIPIISVVMAVKNGGDLLAGSVESILAQTFTDFELIIINDGSTDSTLDTLATFNDPRIVVVSQENQGLARSLNRGITLSRGKYIARQDHDDLSMPTRFEKQLAYMDSNPNCGLLGTASEIWTLEGPTGRYHNHPCDSGVLAFDLLFNNPFVHTSWMLRKSVVDTVGLYTTDRNREPPEDFEYVSRIVRHFDVANLPDRLVVYREVQNSLSSTIRPKNLVLNNPFSQRLALVSAENIAFTAGLTEVDGNAQNFGALTHSYPHGFLPQYSYEGVRALLVEATKAVAARYPQSPVTEQLSDRLSMLYYQCAHQIFLSAEDSGPLLKWCHWMVYRIRVALHVRFQRLRKWLGVGQNRG